LDDRALLPQLLLLLLFRLLLCYHKDACAGPAHVLVDLSLLVLRKSSLHRTGTTGSMPAVSVMMMTHLFADAHLRGRWSIRIFLGCPSAAAAALVAAAYSFAAPSRLWIADAAAAASSPRASTGPVRWHIFPAIVVSSPVLYRLTPPNLVCFPSMFVFQLIDEGA
jgi:hypothetical protein